MSLTDKKLAKVTKLLEVANEEFATHENLIQLSEALVNVIARERDKLLAIVDGQRSEADGAVTSVVADLKKREASLRALIDDLRSSLPPDSTKAVTQLQSELQRVERRIPSKTDLSGIERQIADIEAQLVTVPTEITANPEAVRDALELLQDGQKLAQEAVEGLPAVLEELRKLRSAKTVGGVTRLLRSLADVYVEGITDGQVIAWSEADQKFLATDQTGGSGITVTTPTGTLNGANPTFTVTSTPKWIVADGITYFENNGYTLAALTVTMDIAPSAFIRAII